MRKSRKRIDRFLEDALLEFADWYVATTQWHGKERDCVNAYAHRHLSRRIRKGAAVEDIAQVRIESAAPQPKGFTKLTAPKDLVIWRDGLSTVWDSEWNACDWPWVVMEWKFKRSGKPPTIFDSHDLDWLCGFTAEYEQTFGYLIRVYDGPHGRCVDWAKVARGVLNETNRRS